MLTVAFALSSAAPVDVTVTIYNLLGEPIAEPLRSQELVAGRYGVLWHGRNRRGEFVRPGFYLVEFRAGDDRAHKLIALPGKEGR